MDKEFECLRKDLLDIQINQNTCSENEHVGKVEKLNWKIKERTRGIYNTLHFKKNAWLTCRQKCLYCYILAKHISPITGHAIVP